MLRFLLFLSIMISTAVFADDGTRAINAMKMRGIGESQTWLPEAFSALPTQLSFEIIMTKFSLLERSPYALQMLTEIPQSFKGCEISSKLVPGKVELTIKEGGQTHTFHLALDKAAIALEGIRILGERSTYWILFDQTDDAGISRSYLLKYYLAEDGSAAKKATLESYNNTAYKKQYGEMNALNNPDYTPISLEQQINCL